MPPEVTPLTQPAKTDPAAKPDPAAKAGGADPGGEGQAEKPVRPEGLGKQFDAYWNDDAGLDYAKLGTDFDALTAFKAERDLAAAKVPEKADGYKVELPKDFEIPEGMDFEAIADHPAIEAAREFAHKAGFDQDQFSAMVGLHAKAQIAEFNQLKEAAGKEREKLGTKAEARVTALTQWMTAVLGADHANALLPMMFTAKQVEAFEKLAAAAKGGAPKFKVVGRETTQPSEISDEDYARMSPTDRIARARELKKQAS